MLTQKEQIEVHNVVDAARRKGNRIAAEAIERLVVLAEQGALAAAESGRPQVVRIDPDDKSTWPPLNPNDLGVSVQVLAGYEGSPSEITVWDYQDRRWIVDGGRDYTHWQKAPEWPEDSAPAALPETRKGTAQEPLPDARKVLRTFVGLGAKGVYARKDGTWHFTYGEPLPDDWEEAIGICNSLRSEQVVEKVMAADPTLARFCAALVAGKEAP